MVIATSVGTLTANINMNLASFTVNANGTVRFNVVGYELSQATYQLQVTSYGNGTLNLLFVGMIPFRIQGSPATQSYSNPNAWQQITYTANGSDGLAVIYGNPKLSLNAGVFIAASILVALVVIRTALVAFAPDSEARYAVLIKNRKIFISMCLVLLMILVLAGLFP